MLCLAILPLLLNTSLKSLSGQDNEYGGYGEYGEYVTPPYNDNNDNLETVWSQVRGAVAEAHAKGTTVKDIVDSWVSEANVGAHLQALREEVDKVKGNERLRAAIKYV